MTEPSFAPLSTSALPPSVNVHRTGGTMTISAAPGVSASELIAALQLELPPDAAVASRSDEDGEPLLLNFELPAGGS
jgi:hypothetical protein